MDGLETNLRFVQQVLRAKGDGIVVYRHGEIESLRSDPTVNSPADPMATGVPMSLGSINPEVCRELIAARRTINHRDWMSYDAQLRRYDKAQASLQRQGGGRRCNPVPFPEPPSYSDNSSVGRRTVQIFDTEMRMFFDWMLKRNLLPENPWRDIKVAEPERKHVAIHMVPTLDQVWAIADEIASIEGGARYRVPILAAFELALRAEEFFAVEPD